MGKINNENTLEEKIIKNLTEICSRVDPMELVMNIHHKLRRFQVEEINSIVEKKSNKIVTVYKIIQTIRTYKSWCEIIVDALRKCADKDLLILIGVEQAKTEEDENPPHNQNRTTHSATTSTFTSSPDSNIAHNCCISGNLQRVEASPARGSSNNCPRFQRESNFHSSENILSPARITSNESKLPLSTNILPLSTNIPCNSLSCCSAGHEVIIANGSTTLSDVSMPSSDQNEMDGLGSEEYNRDLQEDCGSLPGTVSTFGDAIQVLNPSLQSLENYSSLYCSSVSHGGARKKEAKCMYKPTVNSGTSARSKLVLTGNSCSTNVQTTGHCSEEAVDDCHHLFMEVDSEELSCDAEPSFSGYQQSSIPYGARGPGFASGTGVPSILNGPIVSNGVGVPSIPNDPIVSSGVDVPSIPNGPVVSSGVDVPSIPNGPIVSSGVDVPCIPNGPVVSSGVGLPSIPNGPIVSSGVGVPSIPNSQMVSGGTGVSVLFGPPSLNRPSGRSPPEVPGNLHSQQPFLSHGGDFADPDFHSTNTVAENSANNTHNYYININFTDQAGPSVLMVGNKNFVTVEDPSKDVTASHINSRRTDDSSLMHSSLEGIPSPAETSHETGRKVLRGAAATDLAPIHGLDSTQLKVPHEKNANVHRGRKEPSAVGSLCSQQEHSAELCPCCTLDSHETNLKQGAHDHTLWRSGDNIPRTLGMSHGLDVSPNSFTLNRVDHETSLKRTVGGYSMPPGGLTMQENSCESLAPLSVTNADHETNLKQIADSRSISTAVNAVVSTPVQVEESNLGICDISLNQVCQAVNDPLDASDLVAE